MATESRVRRDALQRREGRLAPHTHRHARHRSLKSRRYARSLWCFFVLGSKGVTAALSHDVDTALAQFGRRRDRGATETLTNLVHRVAQGLVADLAVPRHERRVFARVTRLGLEAERQLHLVLAALEER